MDAWPRMLLSPKLLNPQGVFRTLQKTLGPFNNIDLISRPRVARAGTNKLKCRKNPHWVLT